MKNSYKIGKEKEKKIGDCWWWCWGVRIRVLCIYLKKKIPLSLTKRWRKTRWLYLSGSMQWVVRRVVTCPISKNSKKKKKVVALHCSFQNLFELCSKVFLLSHNSYCPISKYSQLWHDFFEGYNSVWIMGWLLLGGVKSITNSKLSLSWILKKWQRDMIQCPLLFTIGSSYDWIHLTVTGMKARLVISDHAMKAHKSLYWSEKDLQKFVVCFSDIWWHLQEAISPLSTQNCNPQRNHVKVDYT